MRVSHRLYLAASPSILGVMIVAALAYWGQFAREVPELLLAIAVIGAVSTMALSWINVRYVAERVERLARTPVVDTSGHSLTHAPSASLSNSDASRDASRDELGVIAGVVDNLTQAVRSEHAGRLDAQREVVSRQTGHARMLADIAASALDGLNEIRLPLHILLENHFGELNENQEEMLVAARVAAESIDRELVAVRDLAALDLGELHLRSDRIFPADLLRALLPTLQAEAKEKGVTLQVDLAALVPPVLADGIRVQSALRTLISGNLSSLLPDTQATLRLSRDENRSTISFAPLANTERSAQRLLAHGILRRSGWIVQETEAGLRVSLPR